MNIGSSREITGTKGTGAGKLPHYSRQNDLLNPTDKSVISGKKDKTSEMMRGMKKLEAMAMSGKAVSSESNELNQRVDDLFKRAKGFKNPVISSMEPVIRNARFIKMDLAKIKEAAANLTTEQLKPSDWKFPVYIDEDSPKTIDFFTLQNSINFMFFDPKTGAKFETEYGGTKWSGSTGMVASLKRATEEGIPILDADYLANVTPDQMRHIFRGNMEMPLLKERTEIFHEVGGVLNEKYGGSFANLAKAANYKAFDDGNGIVERLTRDFPSFNDVSTHKETGKELVFNKRAQLAVAMLYTRLQGTGLFDIKDIDQLTVFADYQLPRGLRAMGILKYEKPLADKVDNKRKIPKDSLMEQELRAFTVVAAKLLEDEINKRGKVKTDARGIDYLLWSNARKDKDSNFHMTTTTAY